MIGRRTLRCTFAIAAVACVEPGPVRIGLVASPEGMAGARFAAAEINRSGGIRGRPFVLREFAGGSTHARAAVVAAESLSTDPSVIAVVGHSNSSASLAGAQIYNARRVVQIAPTSSAAILAEAGSYTFRLVASDIHQARFLASEVVRQDVKAVAVFYVNDDYGRSLRQEMMTRLEEARVDVVVEVPYAEADTLPDAEAAARAMAINKTTSVVWLGRSAQLLRALPILRQHVPHVRVLASDGVDGRETAQNRNGVFTGVQYSCFVDVNGTREELTALRDRYSERTGRAMTAEFALTYDAVTLIATAARDAGTTRRAVLGYLRSLGRGRPAFAGATGDVAFDATGGPRPSYCLAEVTRDGVRMARGKGSP